MVRVGVVFRDEGSPIIVVGRESVSRGGDTRGDVLGRRKYIYIRYIYLYVVIFINYC